MQIFLLKTPKVWFEGELGENEEKEVGYWINSVRMEKDAIKGGFVLDQPFFVPEVVVRKDGEGHLTLLKRDEIKKVLAEELRSRVAKAIDKLHDDLRALKLKHDGEMHGGIPANFLGCTAVADVATEFLLEVNPEGLLPPTADAAVPVFRALASARFQGGFSSPVAKGGADAFVRIAVELGRDGVLQALPRIDVPALPHWNLEFPDIALPQWSLDGLALPDLSNAKTLLRFLNLHLPDKLGVALKWDPAPKFTFKVDGGNLTVATIAKGTAYLRKDADTILTAKGVGVTVAKGDVKLDVESIASDPWTGSIDEVDLSERLPGPFVVKLSGLEVSITIVYTMGQALAVTIEFKVERLLIQARTDPALVLALAVNLKLEYADDKLTPTLQKVEVVEPYPIKLALMAAHVIEEAGRRLLAFVQKIPVPDVGAPQAPGLPSMDGFLAVLRRIGELAAAAAAWLAEQGIAGARALAGLAEAAFKLLGELIANLANAISKAGKAIGRHVAIELRMDFERWRLVQVVVSPADPAVGEDAFDKTFFGLRLEMNYDLSPALVYDLEKGWVALVLQTTVSQTAIKLSTDLWLAPENGPTEPVSGSDKPGPSDPLIKLTATPNADLAIALVVLHNGKASFFRALKTTPTKVEIKSPTGGVVVPIKHPLLGASIDALGDESQEVFKFDAEFKTDRILSMFRGAGPSSDPADKENLCGLSQYIKVTAARKPDFNWPRVTFDLDVTIKISDTEVTSKVALFVDLMTLQMSMKGGRFDIEVKEEKRKFSLFGLDGTFEDVREKKEQKEDQKEDQKDTFAPLVLDFSDGDPRLGLNDKVARIDLCYSKLSSSGRGLKFNVDQFMVSRDGVDLAGRASSDPVTLSGVDMPFQFDQGQLAIKRSRIQSFAISGHGNLPPALVGEAKASIELNFAQRNGRLALQAAKAVLDKSSDPLRCESTRFSITISKLGLKFVEQAGYHFYFTLTGAAEFKPNGDEFGSGLLKNLGKLRIVLDEAPLTTDPRVLLQHIEFQVAVEPPKRSTFFDLFDFELRGVGFHPAAPAFGGTPAFSISGQVNFTKAMDAVAPRFDFHKMWIAPGKGGGLPRIRFDGLGVGLSLGSAAEASGTAIAVDDNLPTLLKPDLLPANVTAKGFLASGSLRIKGWASMSASMGFLELGREGTAEKRHAFFLYIQQNDLSEKIPTPIGTIFLREVGFGAGYRYTLAGIAAADRAESPRELIKVLDEVSKYQGNLDDYKAWTPTFDNSSFTVAIRALLSLTTASDSSSYNEKGEKELPNLVLFDIVAALRTDLTFLMNVRAWIAYNYADWRAGRGQAWQSNPSLTGYMYLSVPRREFLARAVHNPGAEIGNHPKLPDPLKDAMKAVRWSSTLYIRPGLFHHEFGWPYELGFSLGKPDGNFFLDAQGGTVLRFEDSAILYGLAFRARGFIRFAAEAGGSFGASVTARADFALGAKLIAYLSTNVGQSMFYGTITLDVTVSFSVRMWLKTRWFSLSAGFSLALTIHVAVELLVKPTSPPIAARVRAAIAVSAFGRTLSLGIGFAFGDGLEAARVRVERFLALGLSATYPNPEEGVPVARPAPLPEPSRARNASEADRRLDEAAERRETAAPPSKSEEPVEDEPGTTFKDKEVHYWALLFPVKGGKERHYIVQLVPRGTEPVSKDESTAKRSHFYAAPLAVDIDSAEYKLEGLLRDEVLALRKEGVDGGPIEIWTAWKASFGFDGAGTNAMDRPAVKEVFAGACFMPKGNLEGVDYDFTDTEPVAWDTEEPLKKDAEAANTQLADAARSRDERTGRAKRMQQIEEARSCVIATVAQCAQDLANLVTFVDDKATLPSNAPSLEFDPRALGLTFLLTEERVNKLFKLDSSKEPVEPPVSTSFTVATRAPKQGDGEMMNATLVRLFNPPARMFERSSPARMDPKHEIRPTGVLLSWDLEPTWRTSKSVFDDPEYHLKHYEVERRIEGLGVIPGFSLPPPRAFTVKRADAVEFFVRKDNDRVVREYCRRIHSPLHVADDLADLPSGLREALLPPALPGSVPSKESKPFADAITHQTTKIVYRMKAVDIAGTSGAPLEPIAVPISKVVAPMKSVLGAIARFTYDDVPKLDPSWKPGAGFLRFTVEVEEAPPLEGKEHLAPELPDPVDYQLWIARERTIAVGSFGADALSQARSEPAVPARDSDPGESESVIRLYHKPSDGAKIKVDVHREARRLKVPATAPAVPLVPAKPDLPYYVSDTDWRSLLKALDVLETSHRTAARLYLRPVPNETVPPKLRPEWFPVQLQVRIVSRSDDKPPPVDITVERFEHPVDVPYQALTSQNIVTSSGRLHCYYPTPASSFAAFVSGDSDTVLLRRDGERRTAVRLAWNARAPDVARAVDEKMPAIVDPHHLHALTAGFDIFSLDTTAVPDDEDPLRFVSHIGRVQRLPAAERGQEPSETGDFATVEVLYPSESKRLEAPPESKEPYSRKRRQTWYSEAESFLRWPVRVMRRSLLTLPDEVDLAALFAKWRPAMIKVEWVDWPTKVPASTNPPIERPELPPPSFALQQLDPTLDLTPIPNGIITPELAGLGKKPFAVDDVRRVVLRLVAQPPDTIDKEFQDNPDRFANVRLRLTSLGADEKAYDDNGTEFALSLVPAVHPVLADVLDLVRYSLEAGQPAYRRYEPVLESAPPVNGQDLQGFFDETVADRDPHGWGVLRSLGLAASLRLYDVERGRYVASDETSQPGTLRLLNDALKMVLPRYAAVRSKIGAPFVDVMFTTDGLAEVASFHGSAPIYTDAANTLRKRHALALVQLELRPTALPLTPGYDPTNEEFPRVVRYATLWYCGGPDDAPALVVRATMKNVMVEIEPLQPTDGAGGSSALLWKDWPNNRPFPHGEESTDRIDDALQFQGRPAAGEVRLAFVRFIAFVPKTSIEDLEKLIAVAAKRGDAEVPVKVKKRTATDIEPGDFLVEEASDLATEHAGPWGRFAPLSDPWLAALVFGDGLEPDPLTQDKVMARLESVDYPPLATLRALSVMLTQRHGPDRFGLPANVFVSRNEGQTLDDQKQDVKKRLALIGRIGAWTRRFLEHGPATRPRDAGSGVAFAMLTRPTPWQVAPDDDGQLSILLLEKDRYGKLRKYAVRPFGRYENLVAAVQAESGDNALARPSLDGAFPDDPNADPLYTHFADAVTERTEPLSAPVIVATRRNDVVDAEGVARPGETLQIIVSRHSEEIISDANIRVDAGLAVRHVAVGFWREFAAPNWARVIDPGNTIDLLEPFGPFKGDNGRDYARLSPPKGLSIVADDGEVRIDSIRELYERHPDLWRGAYVLNLAGLPYGFRLHATAHVAAGVTVSPPSVATIDEAGYQLQLPWKVQAGASAFWQDKIVAPPRWWLDRDGVVPVIVARWPLVRIVDGVLDDARAEWLRYDAAPDLYRLPDPAVSYRIGVETEDSSVHVAEVEFGAISNDPEKDSEKRKGLYLPQAIGLRFDLPKYIDVELAETDGTPTHYELTAALPLRVGGAEDPPKPKAPPNFAPRPFDVAPEPADLTATADAMAKWGHISPEALGDGSNTLKVTITPPNVGADPKWMKFKDDLTNFLDALKGYSDAGPDRVTQVADKLIEEIKKLAVDFAKWPLKDPTGKFAKPVTLDLPWLLGLPATELEWVVVAPPAKGWAWPGEPPREIVKAANRAVVGTLLDDAKNGELKPVAMDALFAYALAWWAYLIAARRYEDEPAVHGYAPLRAKAPEDTAADELPKALATNGPVDVVVSVVLEANSKNQEAIETAFAALEGAPGTADTLEGLATLWQDTARGCNLRVRWSARESVETALALEEPDYVVETVVVRTPCLETESKVFADALRALVDRLSREMLLGPRRDLIIQAFHGLARPVTDTLPRGSKP